LKAEELVPSAWGKTFPFVTYARDEQIAKADDFLFPLS
jgi:hypothetical protein